MKKINSDILFEMAIFFLPFENFFFAPSAGWAAISPLILVGYLILNIKNAPKIINDFKHIIFFFIIGFIFTTINLLTIDFTFNNFINASISIGLGLICLLSLGIYYKKNQKNKEKAFNKIIKLIIISYSISLICGILQYIAIKENITIIYSFFANIFKRNYLMVDRVQFFFTESSFIGMHLFGILLPLYLITKNKKLIRLILIFSFLSIYFSSGVRIIIDIIVIILIFLYQYLIKRKNYILILFIPLLTICLIYCAYNYNLRVKHIIDHGIYADGSLASRYFRINASIHGYKEQPLHFLLGYGIGNSIIPLRDGYFTALNDYNLSYLKEIRQLGNINYTSDSVSYCLYIRVISEYGFILCILAIAYLISLVKKSNFPYKWAYFLTILYLYIQFDSLAFYALWLFIVTIIYTKEPKERNFI